MLERRDSHVLEEELERQKEFIQLVADRNDGKIPKYYLNTFGCQMNEHDSEKLAGMLSNMGYVETDDVDESDLIIYNTCCVREHAEQKVYGHLGSLKRLKEEKPELKIAICGCMMQQKEVVSHIEKTYRHVDLIFGTHNLHKFPELLYKSFDRDKMIIDVLYADGQIVENIPVKRKDNIKAWITVMYGCNNFCSYCIVPYVRGRERSREVKDIKEEVMMLGRQGFKEITLLGQNVNSYGKDLSVKVTFAELLYQLNEVPGIERIRFLTSHPKDLSDELIFAMRDLDKVCEHLHLPFQAGSTKVLKEMNRGYTKEEYLELVMKVKENIPGISLTTDIIVGFPGETDEDFEDTLDIIRKVRFDSAYTFLYSKRTGTPAAKSKNQVPDEVKKERFERLLTLQNSISREINETFLGKKVEILVEGISKTNDNIYTGRTRGNKIVNYKGSEDDIGKLKNVLIEEVKTWSLEGRLIKEC
ncbi:MAG TPA: tRNA (N6-isopentenyl adenosine(37)-C2)-methylthiotransferase MiaB [Ruminiclostridium sp.]|uniref:tRNA (N6-isopentenyl adenosine(37)-C2)-methylthiotransferase MiaB n=1 Tax=Acetivibrio saccincola TaxID=1677857 RepID=UPI000C6E412F|nr:tRNA (N6-isopentenyl adenosine(37)-C2)-methylthiotransferase MiaB [Acetivibrio saccincola]NLW26830.1 tRNA (N6-isopentenyl adenosine(37)-C2)-methylthiotransferase MiaB [Acetivibrio saccincola]HAA42982.1 tRNA (N6-isopentenyl adenosine(37)-C2)-methylthiotransferase MiaB [Ruminiclostridium sp.]